MLESRSNKLKNRKSYAIRGRKFRQQGRGRWQDDFNPPSKMTSTHVREACICKACIMCFVCELYVAWKDCFCNHPSCLYLFLNIID